MYFLSLGTQIVETKIAHISIIPMGPCIYWSQKMSKSLFNLYLQKVSEGDQSFIDRLCERIADRLILIPCIEQQKAADGGTKINVVKINEAHRSLIPIFSSAKLLKQWAQKTGHSEDFVSVLGADFCAALSEDSWLAVDPGSSTQVELQPYLVSKIAQFESNESRTESEPTKPEVVAQVAEPERAAISEPVPTPSPQKLELDKPKEKRTFLSFLKFGK